MTSRKTNPTNDKKFLKNLSQQEPISILPQDSRKTKKGNSISPKRPMTLAQNKESSSSTRHQFLPPVNPISNHICVHEQTLTHAPKRDIKEPMRVSCVGHQIKELHGFRKKWWLCNSAVQHHPHLHSTISRAQAWCMSSSPCYSGADCQAFDFTFFFQQAIFLYAEPLPPGPLMLAATQKGYRGNIAAIQGFSDQAHLQVCIGIEILDAIRLHGAYSVLVPCEHCMMVTQPLPSHQCQMCRADLQSASAVYRNFFAGPSLTGIQLPSFCTLNENSHYPVWSELQNCFIAAQPVKLRNNAALANLTDRTKQKIATIVSAEPEQPRHAYPLKPVKPRKERTKRISESAHNPNSHMSSSAEEAPVEAVAPAVAEEEAEMDPGHKRHLASGYEHRKLLRLNYAKPGSVPQWVDSQMTVSLSSSRALDAATSDIMVKLIHTDTKSCIPCRVIQVSRGRRIRVVVPAAPTAPNGSWEIRVWVDMQPVFGSIVVRLYKEDEEPVVTDDMRKFDSMELAERASKQLLDSFKGGWDE
eukprot:Platyproteum_vivax@DN6593_c0_g1_i2.p1